MPAGVVLYLFQGGIFVHLDFQTLKCSRTEILAASAEAGSGSKQDLSQE